MRKKETKYMRKKYLYTIAITMSIMLAGCGTSTSSDNAENSDNKAVSEIENFESKDSSDNSSDESEKQDDQISWAKCQIKTLEEGAFRYSAILTEDDTAWIYRIDLEADEETETLEIPDNIEGKQVTIPASVETIKKGAFELNTENVSYNIENVTVEKNNKQYAKDGQTIYNKKDGSLSVVIVEKNGDKSKYVMSDKVTKLTPEHSVVNHNTEMEAIDEIYLLFK